MSENQMYLLTFEQQEGCVGVSHDSVMQIPQEFGFGLFKGILDSGAGNTVVFGLFGR